MIRTLLLGAAAFALILPSVEAQNGLSDAGVEVLDLPTTDPKSADGTLRVPFSVFFDFDPVVCSAPATFTVTLAASIEATDAAGMVPSTKQTFEPASLSFEVPAGEYVSNSYEGTRHANLTIDLTSDASSQIDANVTVTASYAGGTPPGCVSPEPLPPASDAGRFGAVFLPRPPPVGGAAATSGPAAVATERPATADAVGGSSPGPGLVGALLVALITAVAVRQKP